MCLSSHTHTDNTQTHTPHYSVIVNLHFQQQFTHILPDFAARDNQTLDVCQQSSKLESHCVYVESGVQHVVMKPCSEQYLEVGRGSSRHGAF